MPIRSYMDGQDLLRMRSDGGQKWLPLAVCVLLMVRAKVLCSDARAQPWVAGAQGADPDILASISYGDLNQLRLRCFHMETFSSEC